jgi:hypothetical protein
MIVGIIEKHQTSQHPEEVKEDHMATMRAQKKSSEAVFFYPTISSCRCVSDENESQLKTTTTEQ